MASIIKAKSRSRRGRNTPRGGNNFKNKKKRFVRGV